MRELIYNIIIVMLIVANVVVCALIIDVGKPRCICDECNRARVSGEFYCKEHIYLLLLEEFSPLLLPFSNLQLIYLVRLLF